MSIDRTTASASPGRAEIVSKPLKRLNGFEHPGAGMALAIARRIVSRAFRPIGQWHLAIITLGPNENGRKCPRREQRERIAR